MTFNFEYVRQCEQSGDRSSLHLGLSAGGARFQFRAHPTLNLVSFEAWRQQFATQPGTIVDDYSREWTVQEFLDFVFEKQSHEPKRRHEKYPDQYQFGQDDRQWLDSQGYTFCNYEFS